MELAEAKRIISRYLAGKGRVSYDELTSACRVVQSDREYVRFLRTEIGLDDHRLSMCSLAQSQMHEICEMSYEERRREMPKLAEHLGECESCRRLFWQIKPLWTSEKKEPSKTDRPKVWRKSLSEHIRILLTRARDLLEPGFGPLSQQMPAVAGTLSRKPLERERIADRDLFPGPINERHGATRKVWLLEDDEAGCSIRLVVETELGGGVKVWYELTDANGASGVFEIRKKGDAYPRLQGRLPDIQIEPLVLESGSWVITIKVIIEGISFAWDIHLDIEREGEEEND